MSLWISAICFANLGDLSHASRRISGQARSLDKGVGEPPDFGVGNSSHHTMQIEADGLGMGKSVSKKNYMSPYSQRYKK